MRNPAHSCQLPVSCVATLSAICAYSSALVGMVFCPPFSFGVKEKQETSRDLLLHIMLDMLYFVVSRSIEIHIRHHFRIVFCFHLCSCLIHAIKLTINAIKDIIQSFKKISCLYEIKSFIKRKIHLHTI